jgi:hypothetical protein
MAFTLSLESVGDAKMENITSKRAENIGEILNVVCNEHFALSIFWN